MLQQLQKLNDEFDGYAFARVSNFQPFMSVLKTYAANPELKVVWDPNLDATAKFSSVFGFLYLSMKTPFVTTDKLAHELAHYHNHEKHNVLNYTEEADEGVGYAVEHYLMHFSGDTRNH